MRQKTTLKTNEIRLNFTVFANYFKNKYWIKVATLLVGLLQGVPFAKLQK